MRIKKRLLRPERVRRVPEAFSWVDHRLVRDRYVQRCTPDALALYLFWVTVGDADGLSFYSDSSISRLLSMELSSLREAKRVLVSAELIAVEPPLVQVLSLEPWVPTRRANQASSIGEILKAGGVR